MKITMDKSSRSLGLVLGLAVLALVGLCNFLSASFEVDESGNIAKDGALRRSLAIDSATPHVYPNVLLIGAQKAGTSSVRVCTFCMLPIYHLKP